jgi:hypothetical protein
MSSIWWWEVSGATSHPDGCYMHAYLYAGISASCSRPASFRFAPMGKSASIPCAPSRSKSLTPGLPAPGASGNHASTGSGQRSRADGRRAPRNANATLTQTLGGLMTGNTSAPVPALRGGGSPWNEPLTRRSTRCGSSEPRRTASSRGTMSRRSSNFIPPDRACGWFVRSMRCTTSRGRRWR